MIEQLKCIRLENHKGKSFAISSNCTIACVEYLGETTEPDGVVHIKMDKKLLDKCKEERIYNSILQIEYVPELALGKATTMFGYQHPENPCLFFERTVMDDWRKWTSNKKTENYEHAMSWDVIHIKMLFETSPSGKVVFPRNLDVNIPIILRDVKDPKWVGLFIGKLDNKDEPVGEAELPEWWSK